MIILDKQQQIPEKEKTVISKEIKLCDRQQMVKLKVRFLYIKYYRSRSGHVTGKHNGRRTLELPCDIPIFTVNLISKTLAVLYLVVRATEII